MDNVFQSNYMMILWKFIQEYVNITKVQPDKHCHIANTWRLSTYSGKFSSRPIVIFRHSFSKFSTKQIVDECHFGWISFTYSKTVSLGNKVLPLKTDKLWLKFDIYFYFWTITIFLFKNIVSLKEIFIHNLGILFNF